MTHLPSEDLVIKFRVAAAAHYQATLNGRRRTINKHADLLENVYSELKRRGHLHKAMLTQLLQDPEPPVQVMAACFCMTFAPDATRRTLLLHANRPDLLGLEAKHALQRFDDGTWTREF